MLQTANALRPRYTTDWQAPFEAAIAERLVPGMTILDIGSGRLPSIKLAQRPPRTRYIGLDISEPGVPAASEGAYDDIIVSNAAHFVPHLADRVDLAVSWQVLEHVRPLADAVAHVRCYLKPGGAFVSLLSGRWASFSVT